jgi:hypothetical protein
MSDYRRPRSIEWRMRMMKGRGKGMGLRVKDEETTKPVLFLATIESKFRCNQSGNSRPGCQGRGRDDSSSAMLSITQEGSGIFPPTAKQVHVIAGSSQERRAYSGKINFISKCAFAVMLSQGSYRCVRRFLLLRNTRVCPQKLPVGYFRNEAIPSLLLRVLIH